MDTWITIYIELCLYHCLKQSDAIFVDENKQAENTLTEKLVLLSLKCELYIGLVSSLIKKYKYAWYNAIPKLKLKQCKNP